MIEKAFLYGKNLGLAFQLMDDLLDFVASSEIIGKPAAADLKLGLATAPVLFACEQVGMQNVQRIAIRGQWRVISVVSEVKYGVNFTGWRNVILRDCIASTLLVFEFLQVDAPWFSRRRRNVTSHGRVASILLVCEFF